MKHTCISIFSKIGLASHNSAHKCIRKKIASCINLQLPIIIFKQSTLLDMHHRKTYMYTNFQQNRVSTSAETVHTNLFAKNCNNRAIQLAIRIS